MEARQLAAEAAVFDQTNLLPRKQLLIVFGALAISHFICFVDQTGIGVALPTIGRDLDAEDTISWAGTSALIANTIFQVLYGRMSDLFGRKSVLLSALVLLTVSDLLCGLSRNAKMLYVFRGLAGVANGGIASLSAMIVSDIVTLKERGKWQGMIGGCVGLGQMVGPFVAAGFVQKSTWRGFFWLVSPIAASCGILCVFVLPTPPKDAGPSLTARDVSKRIDYWGILMGSAALILILIPVAGGGDYFAWDSPMVISMLAVGGCCLLAFVFIEKRVALLPMMPLSLFKSGPVSVMLAQNFLFGVVAYSQTYYLPLFFQNARRLSPLTSAALMLPLTGAQMIVSILAGQYISRKERYGEVIWLGFFLWTLGVGLTCTFTLSTPLYAITLILFLQGLGIGAVFQPVLVALQAHCTKAQRAIIISNRNFLRSLGGAVGLAISAAALQNSLHKAMPLAFAHLALSSYDTPDFEALDPGQVRQILQAYARASRTVFIMNVPFLVLCLLGCLLIKDRGLQRPDEVRGTVELSDRSDSMGGMTDVEKSGDGDGEGEGNGEGVAEEVVPVPQLCSTEEGAR
ncbi:MFS general substrate transporter [Decorospora gaudefroyi]|uniref:MFS general substrate transporter n=1 Tax=Decorospora gaudefroyi TaxID=184978 RepID=A0A6A5K7R6_9PLEO|nr:MFS general substrate transporter [Decorospora gaudefroyi]